MGDDLGWPTSKRMWRILRPLAQAMRNALTPEEAALWEALKRDRLRGFRFRRQKAFGKYVVDFYCRDAKLVIEMDGPIHDRQRDNDANRQAYLERLGLRVLRFRNDEVMENPAAVVRAILAVLPKRKPS